MKPIGNSHVNLAALVPLVELEVNTDSSTTQNFSHFMATKAECLAEKSGTACSLKLDTISVRTGTKSYIIFHICHVNMTKYD